MVLVQRLGPDLGELHRKSGQDPGHRAQLRRPAGQVGPADRPDRLPSLGKSSLQAGLISGLAGLLVVLLYIVFYYRMLGLVVLSGLAVTGALLWSIVALLGQSFNVTIDLAGVIGIIVSIGITVDSYIVYFERLKDEARAGRTIRTSVDRGFHSAFRTVLAADAVSLLGAIVLYELSVGDVQGFALFLGISTLLDIVVTYFFTRPFVILLGRSATGSDAGRSAWPVAWVPLQG